MLLFAGWEELLGRGSGSQWNKNEILRCTGSDATLGEKGRACTEGHSIGLTVWGMLWIYYFILVFCLISTPIRATGTSERPSF